MKFTDEMKKEMYQEKKEYTESVGRFFGRNIVYYAPSEFTKIEGYADKEIVSIDNQIFINVNYNSHTAIRDEVCRELYGDGAIGKIKTT